MLQVSLTLSPWSRLTAFEGGGSTIGMAAPREADKFALRGDGAPAAAGHKALGSAIATQAGFRGSQRTRENSSAGISRSR